MKKIFNIFLSSAAVALIATSCDMDLTPKGSVVYDGKVIVENETDLTGVVANVVAQLRGLDYGYYDQSQDVMVDYFNATSSYGNNYGDIHRACSSESSFTASSYYPQYNWEYFYYAIRHFNIAIDGLQEDMLPADFDDEAKADAKVGLGYAYFARAFAYQHLIRHFAKSYAKGNPSSDLGVPLVIHYDLNEQPARATVAEVYDQIVSDLSMAETYLAGEAGSVRAQYPTIDAVHALQARIYLEMGDYSTAASKAVSVINSSAGYALASSADEFTAEFVNDEGNEPILQFFASISEGGYASHGYVCCGISNDSEYGNSYNNPYFLPSQRLIDSYEDSDLRLSEWFVDDLPVNIGGNWLGGVKVFAKYQGDPALSSSSIPYQTQQAIKPLLISEMYLIAAEAYAQSGNTSSAATYLNTLQTARGASATSGSLSNVKNEWYRETVGEGLRMANLKRWGDGFSGRPGQTGMTNALMQGTNYVDKSMSADDYCWVWPIPAYEIKVNPNLVQNEGYGSSE